MGQSGRSAERRDHDAAIIEPGRNCWQYPSATRFSTLVDGADYFAAFASACLAARRQILILGWDFDRHERLYRGEPDPDLPDELGAFLVELVRRRRELEVYLLSWDFNMVYAAERELLPALRLRMQAPPRFHFRLDGEHPKGASHHQKVVVIDDQVAFVGGIDLSRWRWDTSEHLPDDPRRTDPQGNPYPPFHDMMCLVEGDVAARLGDLARERWRRARGWDLRPPLDVTGSPWPEHVDADLRDIRVAIARTEPEYGGRDAVREVERLYLDAIAAAERTVYIENQYFTSRRLAEALSSRLADADGPEVLLVLPLKTGGWLEQVTMDVVRGRILDDLQNADRHGRLRVCYPYQPGLGDDCISVHAKLLIVDDSLLRIGSSNASNRSMGLDTECDLAIEACGDDVDTAAAIRDLRLRLLAEHLGSDPATVSDAVTREGGVVGAIDALSGDGRSLRRLDWRVDPDVDALVPDDGLIDPPEPFSPDYFVAEYVPKQGRESGRRRLWLFLGLLLVLLSLAAAWRWTPLSELLSPERMSAYLASLASPEARAFVAVAGFAVASLAMVPLTLLAVVAGVAFPGWQAFGYVLAGAMIAAAAGFAGGRLAGKRAIEQLSGSRIEQLSRRLARRGTMAVAVLRLVPIAPFAIFNLVAGSSHLGLRQFLVGSLLGLAPGLGAVTLFSNSLWQAVTAPSAGTLATVAVVGLALLALSWLARRWLRSG
jgi:phosphatidylserine/phosphatidylglycerophosphate/cardiolipin synthase-like enzyme/uncharacterized membrane protein YdjX (TVP38/TMEM64 family)